MFDLQKTRAVLWDLDDTLYSRNAAVRLLFPHMFRQLLYRDRSDAFIETAVDFMMQHLRRGVMVHPEAFSELNEQYPFDLPFSLTDCRAYYYAHLREYVTPFPEAVEILKTLRSHGIKTAIVTNITPELLESQKKKVAALGITELFDIIIYSAELGIHKPDPGIFHHTATLLGVAAGECIFVGDDPRSDIAGARGAGMEAVWLDNRPVYDGSFADDPRVHRVRSVLEYFAF